MSVVELFNALFKGDFIESSSKITGLSVLKQELICGECDGDCPGNF